MICTQCPRQCSPGKKAHPGFSPTEPFHYCGKTGDDSSITIARIMIHNWEEPCISGNKGSGAVFFSGCNLGCVFCQNYEISRHDNPKGRSAKLDEVEDSIYHLIVEKGCDNIDFITGSHLIIELTT